MTGSGEEGSVHGGGGNGGGDGGGPHGEGVPRGAGGNGGTGGPPPESHRDLAPSLGLPPWVRVQVVDGGGELAVAAGLWASGALSAALEERGTASVALAGGSTPRGLYRVLEGPFRWRVDWERVEVFQGDERAVPPEDAASNFRMARDELLVRLPVAEERVHRMAGELDPGEAARLYEERLRSVLGHGAEAGTETGPDAGRGAPRLDLVLLGLGDDGHTASLFPAAFAGHERDLAFDPHPGRWVAATQAPAPEGGAAQRRITLTLSTLRAARQVLFLVQGSGKAKAVARTFEALREAERLREGAGLVQGERRPPATARDAATTGAEDDRLEAAIGPATVEIPPAARVRPDDGGVLWLLDREAFALAGFAASGEGARSSEEEHRDEVDVGDEVDDGNDGGGAA